MSAAAEERLARAALSRVCEPETPRVAELVARRGPVAAWAGLRNGRCGLPAATLASLAARVAECRPERDLQRLADVGGRLVCPGDAEWPERLDDLALAGSHPPYALWVRGGGDLAALAARSVAVVGSRAATDYGTYLAAELASDLTARGWSVVSGAAYGVDGAAHRGALAAGGGTVAVLACGVDVPYPTGHRSLLERIGETGAVVSEWPPGAAPHRNRFLTRNRVIAALTAGTVVVEAALRSGALSTAERALRLNRPLMCVPGPVTSALSTGCHRYLRDGAAVLVTGAADVLDCVGPLGGEPLVADPPDRPAGGDPEAALPGEQRRVLDAVPVRQPAPAARIAVTAGLDAATVLAALRALSAAGYVRAVDGGWRLARPARAPAPRDTAEVMLDLDL